MGLARMVSFRIQGFGQRSSEHDDAVVAVGPVALHHAAKQFLRHQWHLQRPVLAVLAHLTPHGLKR